MQKFRIILDSHDSLQHKISLMLIITIGILFRILAFQGYSDSDPWHYAVLASDLSKGILHFTNYEGPPIFPLRIGLYGPPAIIIKIFGLSEISMVAYPFIISLASLVLAYLLGRITFGPFAGLITTLIVVFVPLDIKMATLLSADLVAAFWTNLGIFLVWYAILYIRGIRQQIFVTVAGGFALGISWLCKETIIYLVPFVLILILFQTMITNAKQRIILLLSVAFGILIIFSTESLLYYLKSGDILMHFHTVDRNYDQNAGKFLDTSAPLFGWETGSYLRVLKSRLFINGPHQILNLFNSLLGWAILAIIWAIIWRNRAFKLPGFWLFTSLVMFIFMTTTLKSYRPIPLIDRHLYPLLFPASIITAGFISELFKPVNNSNLSRERTFWGLILFIFVFLFLLYRAMSGFGTRPEYLERLISTKIKSDDIIYTDYKTARSLTFFRTGTLSPCNAKTIPYEDLRSDDIPKGTYVLIDNDLNKFLFKSYNYKFPVWLDRIPSNWVKVWSGMDAVLYKITDFSKQNRLAVK